MQEIKVGDILKIKYDSINENCVACVPGLSTHFHVISSSYTSPKTMLCIVAKIKPILTENYTKIYYLLNNHKILIRLGRETSLDGAPFEILSD